MYTVLFYQTKFTEQRKKIEYYLTISQNKKYFIKLTVKKKITDTP